MGIIKNGICLGHYPIMGKWWNNIKPNYSHCKESIGNIFLSGIPRLEKNCDFLYFGKLMGQTIPFLWKKMGNVFLYLGLKYGKKCVTPGRFLCMCPSPGLVAY